MPAHYLLNSFQSSWLFTIKCSRVIGTKLLTLGETVYPIYQKDCSCCSLYFHHADQQREEKRLEKQKELERRRKGIDDTWADRFVHENVHKAHVTPQPPQLPPSTQQASGTTEFRWMKMISGFSKHLWIWVGSKSLSAQAPLLCMCWGYGDSGMGWQFENIELH